MDVEQFLDNCKTSNIAFRPDFLEFITDVDEQSVILKDHYSRLTKMLKAEELNGENFDQLGQCLNGIEQVFIQLKNLFETYEEKLLLLEELGVTIDQIFLQVEYVYGLDQTGARIWGDLKKDFHVLELEKLQQTIEILQKIVNFKPKNETHLHLSDTALEIKGFCEDLGSLSNQFLPYVLLWKLPPKLLRLYKSAEKINKKSRIFSECVKEDYFSRYLTKAVKSFNKINKKYLESSNGEKKPVKIRGSSGLKGKVWSLGQLRIAIRTNFLR